MITLVVASTNEKLKLARSRSLSTIENWNFFVFEKFLTIFGDWNQNLTEIKTSKENLGKLNAYFNKFIFDFWEKLRFLRYFDISNLINLDDSNS